MAQLVARLVRNEKVGGSNPPSSTTGRHPIADVGFLYAWACSCGACCCVDWCRWCSGRLLGRVVGPGRCVCRWAAARPRAVCAASFARRVAAKPGQAPPPAAGAAARPCHRPRAPQPGPAAAHRYGGALRTLRRPPHRRRLVADVLLGASARSPARPRHHPPAPRPGLAALHAVGAAGIRDRACCLRLRWCSGRRRARPPARSLHASLRLGVVDLEARPCPPVPSAPSTPIEPGVLMCGSVCRFDVRPRPAIAHEHRGRRLT